MIDFLTAAKENVLQKLIMLIKQKSRHVFKNEMINDFFVLISHPENSNISLLAHGEKIFSTKKYYNRTPTEFRMKNNDVSIFD